jgi:hypothetical protein
LTLVPATIVAMQGVPRNESGLASGLLNTSRLIGGALGLAVLSTIATGQARGGLSAAGSAAAITHGYDVALGIGATFCLAGAAVAALLLRPRAASEIAPAGEPVSGDRDREDLLAA